MKFLSTMALALLLLAVESVVVHYAGFSVARFDVTVLLIAFLSLRANTLEGAFASFGIGYLLDAMSGHPTGLFVFLGVFLFLLGRLAASLVDVRTGFAFALFAMGADAVHGLLAMFFSWMVTQNGGGSVPALLSGLPVSVLLTGAVSLAIYPLLRKIDPGSERPQAGVLL